mmetsp:Transcript_22460/g.39471  ORF Transcript_22460/g.39471 Transcript_22460/m.39471 type:complete len:100 (+) Transcript_22460:196-495(+)
MWALLTHKMIFTLACLLAVLTVNIDHGVLVDGRHRLHSDSLIQQRKIVRHVFHTSHAKRAGVVLLTPVLSEAGKMHNVSTFQSPQWFGGAEERIVTNRA